MNLRFNRLRHVSMLNRSNHNGIKTEVIMLLFLHHPLAAQTQPSTTPLCDNSFLSKRRKSFIRILKLRKRLFLFATFARRTDSRSPLLMHVLPVLAFLSLIVSLLGGCIQVFVVKGAAHNLLARILI
jgi:hypothetical protein